MAQSIKRKTVSSTNRTEDYKIKKQKTVLNGSAPHRPYKASNSKISKPITKPEPALKHKKSEVEDENSDFDGFTSDDEKDGGVPLPEVNEPAVVNHANGDSTSNKSRESHKKQKELAVARKASKPNADDIARAKKIWERLRLKSHIQKDERQKLVSELFDIITGRVHDFVFKHDSVRIIQCAVKYSTIAQKKEIAKELKGNYKSLAESRYAKFLLAKIITEGDDETKALIIPEFYGHVRRLLNHPEAAWILDDIYRSVATKDQKAILLRELYGPEFAVFKTQNNSKVTSDLNQILKGSPEKRTPILQYLRERINQLIQKKMTGFTMLHDAMLQYFSSLSSESEEFSAFLRLIIGDKEEEETDLLRNLAFTQSGSELVCLVIAHSPAKDRRQILKAYKEVFEMLAYDKYGHRVILAAFEVMDDTREIVQRVYSEIILLTKGAQADDQTQKIMNLATNTTGHAVLLYPFVGAKSRLLIPPNLKLMQKVQKIREATSKKEPAVRRTELLTPISPLFIHAIESHASSIVSNSFGCIFVTEVILDGQGEKHEAVKAVAKAVEGDPDAPGHVAHSPFTGKMLKTLISGGRFDRKSGKVIPLEPPLHFAELLLESIEPHLKAWALGDGGFVVRALLEATWTDQAGLKKVQKTVKDCELDLEKTVTEGENLGKAEKTDAEEVASKRRRATSAKHLLEAISK